MTRFFVAVDRILYDILKVSIIAATLGIIVLVTWAVIGRRTGLPVIKGWDEYVELFFAWLVYMGVLAHWRDRTLFRVELIDGVGGEAFQRLLRIVIALLMLALSVVMLVWGGQFAFDTMEVTPVLNYPKAYWYAALPVAAAGLVVYSVVHVWWALTNRHTERPKDVSSHL